MKYLNPFTSEIKTMRDWLEAHRFRDEEDAGISLGEWLSCLVEVEEVNSEL